MESLIFFTAIITFIVSTVQIASKSAFHEAVALILVMVGGLLVSFGAFRFLLQSEKRHLLSTLFFIAAGLAIILLSLLLNGNLLSS